MSVGSLFLNNSADTNPKHTPNSLILEAANTKTILRVVVVEADIAMMVGQVNVVGGCCIVLRGTPKGRVVS